MILTLLTKVFEVCQFAKVLTYSFANSKLQGVYAANTLYLLSMQERIKGCTFR